MPIITFLNRSDGEAVATAHEGALNAIPTDPVDVVMMDDLIKISEQMERKRKVIDHLNN